MPTIKDKLYFNYDGIWSSEFNLMQISLSGGMFEETFVASREISETTINGSDKPLLNRVTTSPLEFEITVGFEKKYTDADIHQIVMWLFKDNYKPLYFQGKEDRIYYCMAVGDASIAHNGLNQGYITITMRCDSSRIYSNYVYTDSIIVVGSSNIKVFNDGHYEAYPEISIKKIGAGVVTIESLSDYSHIFEVRNLTNQEDLYIDCKRELIETDAIGIYRYDDVIGEFPRIKLEWNEFKVTGNCVIQFRFKKQYKF